MPTWCCYICIRCVCGSDAAPRDGTRWWQPCTEDDKEREIYMKKERRTSSSTGSHHEARVSNRVNIIYSWRLELMAHFIRLPLSFSSAGMPKTLFYLALRSSIVLFPYTGFRPLHYLFLKNLISRKQAIKQLFTKVTVAGQNKYWPSCLNEREASFTYFIIKLREGILINVIPKKCSNQTSRWT